MSSLRPTALYSPAPDIPDSAMIERELQPGATAAQISGIDEDRRPGMARGKSSPMPSQDGALVFRLTRREVEVLRLVADGMSGKEVAQELAIRPRTVERHLDQARLKTRTRNRTHMVAHVIRAGLI